MNKRYAIVRVDRFCPSKFEEIENLNVCAEPIRYYMNRLVNCKNCRYGDTKEQLIKKVAQVMLRKFVKGYLGNAIKPKLAKEQIEIMYKNYLAIAKEIVEFLGVE